MKLHTNMLSGVDDNVVIMHMLAKPHVSRERQEHTAEQVKAVTYIH